MKFSWRIAGEAGQGILNTGLMFAKACMNNGLYVFSSSDYPSLIRGGHNFLDITISNEPVHSCHEKPDLVVALNKESIEKHGSIANAIIYDKLEKDGTKNKKAFPVPLMTISQECGSIVMRNTVAMASSLALIGIELETFNNVIKHSFKNKGENVINKNIEAAKKGYEYSVKNFKPLVKLPAIKNQKMYLVSGNDAVSAGAIQAGCKFFAAYPMTPATSILHNMAFNEENYNIVIKHTEDEIAAINMAIGASFAGVRSMTATSGGGFALMVEALGLAAMTETPLVAVDSQRPGPATGMATRTGQGDLSFILNAAPDDFPRLVIAPGDVEECFDHTVNAFIYSEKYQMPALILVDKHVSISHKTVPMFKPIKNQRYSMIDKIPNNYLRYKITSSGISPRTIPSQLKGMHCASSYEHDEKGNESEDSENRIKMHDKRFRKLESLVKEIPEPIIYGPKNAKFTLITWGSTKGAVLEAIKELKNVNMLHFIYLSPFKTKNLIEIMKGKTCVIEGNKTSQLSALIKQNIGKGPDYKILKYDGRPFTPEYVIREVKKILRIRN